MSKNKIETLLKAVFDAETVSFDLSDQRENLVFVMGPRASKVNAGIYARKALHRLAADRYLADQQH
jgi:hypothetical protein